MISALELTACITAAFSVWLAARNNIHTWWTGIIGCILYGWVFWNAQLYADVTLQVFFVATSILGWLKWRSVDHGIVLPISRTPFLVAARWAGVAVVVALAYAAILHVFTDAWSPWLDSVILTFSVLAQFLLVGRRMESWYAWLVVNSIAVPLYAMRGLYLTSGLYAILWCSAWYGLLLWRRRLAAK